MSLEQLREAVHRLRDSVSMRPGPGDRALLERIERIDRDYGLSLPGDVHELASAGFEAAFNNDWDEAVVLLLKAIEMAGDSGSPPFLRKRLGAVLANRAEATMAAARSGAFDRVELHDRVAEAIEDLESALVLDSGNETIAAALARASRYHDELPDEALGRVLDRADELAASDGPGPAVDLLRRTAGAGLPPLPPALRRKLVSLLITLASAGECDDRGKGSSAPGASRGTDALAAAFEACLLEPDNPEARAVFDAGVEALSGESSEAVTAEKRETALSLGLVAALDGRWEESLDVLGTVFPRLAGIVESFRDSSALEFLVRHGVGPGREVPGLFGLSFIGAADPSADSFRTGKGSEAMVRLAAALFAESTGLKLPGVKNLFVLDGSVSTSSDPDSAERISVLRECRNAFIARFVLEGHGDGGTPEMSLFERVFDLADEGRFKEAMSVLDSGRSTLTGRGAAACLAGSLRYELCWAAAVSALNDIVRKAPSPERCNELLAEAKSLLSVVSDTPGGLAGGGGRLAGAIGLYDEIVARLGDDVVSVSTFSEDRFWRRYFLIFAFSVMLLALLAMFY